MQASIACPLPIQTNVGGRKIPVTQMRGEKFSDCMASRIARVGESAIGLSNAAGAEEVL